ncbi:nuclear transport factor 2 family protein [Paraglaciecola sp. 2405UD69-4]|uniref:nuclear transport factor 2 family protein n=1 Tax=Paraglaciecola sp. 2405UD69-4 TaxID=3391836 RepID=UPI0039C8E11D
MNSKRIERFVATYQKIDIDNISLLREIYHSDITFIDPLHKVQGIAALEEYFQHLYSNVKSISFNIDETLEVADKGCLYWTMSYSHPSLNSGKVINVLGHSRLTFDNEKVIFHQDYLDTNSMIFEHIPVVGHFIKYLKKRAAK